ncbi:MAG: CorA family divalent cation transporter [Caldilineaceae bacterium]
MTATYSIVAYDKVAMDYGEADNVEDILALVKPERINWITMSGITIQDDHEAFRRLLDYFSLNPLLFDSFFGREQQEQFEGEYDDCLYMDYAVLLYRPSRGVHKRVRGSIILTANALLLLEKTPSGIFGSTRRKILARHTRAQYYHADYLLYLLIKTIVINYQEIYRALVAKFEKLEDEVIGSPGSERVYDKILGLREEFKPLYAHLVFLSDFVGTISEEQTRFIGNGTKKRLNTTIGRETEALMAGHQYLRSWIAELIEIHRANVNESTNRVMKILTVFSTIFLPLTFIAGVYGMNFQNMPELAWEYGYYVVLLLMGCIAAGALLFMRYKKWL